MPVVHNPFPQLSRVAVAPFLNLSDEPTVDGRQFALAYFSELQSIPGFEVVPLGIVEETMIAERIDLSNAGDARRLAQLLGVDVVVVGAVTDFTPYYPPRCGMRVEWYTANPGFHEIPAGYGLPWGTPDEEYIPQRVVFDAELALAQAQMETQSPTCGNNEVASPLPLPEDSTLARPLQRPGTPMSSPSPSAVPSTAPPAAEVASPDDPFESSPESLPPIPDAAPAAFHDLMSGAPVMSGPGAIDTPGAIDPSRKKNFAGPLPAGWPDSRGFIPPGPSLVPPPGVVNRGPVITHTRIFQGHDPEFTAALAAYVDFRDDARFGGWRSYLERSDDFIRFCCHLHLSDMLAARGGASETRVVRHWSKSR